MAYDKVIDSAELDADLTAVADAIRTKGGTSEALSFPDGFVSAVEGIQAGGGGDNLEMWNGILSKTCTEINLPGVTTISTVYRLFSQNSKLVSVYLPDLTFSDSQYMLANCSNLETLYTPLLTKVPAYALENSTKIKSVRFPKASIIDNAICRGCTALEYADFGNADHNQSVRFSQYAFQNCTSFKVLVIRSNAVWTLYNVTVFANSPFAEGNTGGVLLVPSTRVNEYAEATNWSVLYGYGTNRFLPLEEYTVDGTTSGEIDWDKVNALFEE